MSDPQLYPYKILIKGSRVNNAQGAPATICDQEVLCDLDSLKSEVEASVTRAVGDADAQKIPGRVRLLVRVIRRSDNRKEDLKEICTTSDAATRAAESAHRLAVALSGDPPALSPMDIVTEAADFGRASVEKMREAAAWIAPLAAAPSPAAAVAATATVAAKKAGERAVAAAATATVAAAGPPGGFEAFFSNILKNVFSNPEMMRNAEKMGRSLAPTLAELSKQIPKP